MRAALLAGVVAVSAMAAGGGAQSGAGATRCGKWTVPASIAGEPLCLRERGSCRATLRTAYARYGFTCTRGALGVTWRTLRARPLRVTQLSPGSACPLTTKTTRIGTHAALGPGPAAPIGTWNTIKIDIPPPPEFGGEWSGAKRVWLVAQNYPGRILLRGRQVDGDGEMRFVDGRPGFTPAKLLNPVPEYHLDGPGGFPSLTRLRTPGCYAYQLDGRTFTYTIVFQALAN